MVGHLLPFFSSIVRMYIPLTMSNSLSYVYGILRWLFTLVHMDAYYNKLFFLHLFYDDDDDEDYMRLMLAVCQCKLHFIYIYALK
jgi:hypothetical protein